MRFLIVTPTFNRSTYLDDTIESVVSQEGDFEVDYIVQDGGSGQELIDILGNWQRKVRDGTVRRACNNLSFRWFSGRDIGLYDAVRKGFEKGHGDVMAWINSDDIYHPKAFQAVGQIFSQFEDVQWITGIPNSINRWGNRTGFDCFPKAFSRHFIARGLYDPAFRTCGFNWIPQDSCFWRSTLWAKSGTGLDAGKKYAADFFLWQDFAKYADLVKIKTFLGSYRFHGEQVTSDPQKYHGELPGGRRPPTGLMILGKLAKSFPFSRRFMFGNFPLAILLGLRREWLTGRVIEWSHEDQQWAITVRPIF